MTGFLVEAPFGSVGRNLFGAGCLAQLPAELAKLGSARAAIVGSGTHRSITQLELVEGVLAERHAHTWTSAAEYIYPEAVAAAEAELRAADVDCVVTVGGCALPSFASPCRRARALAPPASRAAALTRSPAHCPLRAAALAAAGRWGMVRYSRGGWGCRSSPW